MRNVILVLTLLLLVACAGKNTESNVEIPGVDKSGKSKTLELGADLLRNKSPLKKINAYLDGFHFYNGNINAQNGSPPVRLPTKRRSASART